MVEDSNMVKRKKREENETERDESNKRQRTASGVAKFSKEDMDRIVSAFNEKRGVRVDLTDTLFLVFVRIIFFCGRRARHLRKT